LGARKVTGEPVVVARNAAVPSISADGTLAFIRGIGRALRQFVLVDRTGQIVTRFGQPSDLWAIGALSPDVRRAAGEDNGDQDIYLHDDRGARVRATFTNTEHDMISFSADGEVVYFSTGTQAKYRIGSKTIDSNEPETVIVEAGEMGPHYFGATPFATSDGKILFYSAKGPNNKQDVAWVDLTRKSEPQRFLSSPAAEYGAVPSPADYTYVAYVSDESGRAQIYLTTFPGAERKVPVSIDGGVWPRWKGDGSELYFASGNDILAVSVSYDPLSVGKPQKLFSRPENDDRQPFGWPPTFDVTADGERFLVMDPVVSEETQPSIAIIPGWAATMR